MRKLSLLAIIIVSVLLSGCSFSSDLVVMNLSDRPIDVRYRFKEYPGPFSPDSKPATKPIAEISRDYDWHELSPDRYVVGSHTRTVTVTVAPKTALLVDQINGSLRDDDSLRISEIMMRGAGGIVILQGTQLRKSFVREKKQVYSISYK